jgi:putative ABC transport system permease protein
MRWWQIRKREADLDRELRSDLELEEEEQRENGVPGDEARHAARRAFGNPTLIREQTHEAWGWAAVEHLWQDVRYAWRQVRRSTGFSAVVVATLTLGVGATTSIFTIVNSTLLSRLPYPEADHIVRVEDIRLQGQSAAGLMKVPRFFDLQARNKSFESIAFFCFDNATLIAGTRKPVAVRGVEANAGFWRVFRGQPLLGRTFDERDDRPNVPEAVVLSYKGWQRIFQGDPGVVGSRVTIQQRTMTIVGVMPQEFNVPNGIDMWRPAQFDPGQWTWRGAGSGFLNVFGLLRPGVSAHAAQSDIARIGEQLQQEHPDTDGIWRFGCRSFRDDLYGKLRPALLVLWVASGFLLLMACINVANLLLTRAAAREQEVALRRALGASEGRIRLQFLVESTLLAVIGGGGGLGLAWTLIRVTASRLPGRLGVPGIVQIAGPVVWFAFGVTVASAILFGLAPALQGRREAPNLSLKQRDRTSDMRWMRNAYIAIQVGLSFVLLVGASLLGQSLWNLVKSPLGFAPDHLLTFEISLPWSSDESAARNFFLNTQERIEALPGVTAVGQIDALPTVDWHLRGNFDADWLPRVPNHPAIGAEDRHIAGNYLGAMSTPIMAGRAFTAQDQMLTSKSIMVNQELAEEYLPGGNPVGRHLIVGDTSFQIVGVLADVRGTAGSIAKAPGPEVYWPADADRGVVQRYFVVRSQAPPSQLVNSIQEQIREVDPLQAISNVATMDELLNKSVAQPRLNTALIGGFAGLTLLLACVGIYGVVAWTVSQRIREIGVRMALGATRSQISLFFLKRALGASLLGMSGGLAAALLLTRLLRSQLYGVTPGNPRAYAFSILVLLVPVFVATLRPALHASSINPVEALRAE